ncbi:uncharacterized protein LOC144442058 [Glandiceps talaboti]
MRRSHTSDGSAPCALKKRCAAVADCESVDGVTATGLPTPGTSTGSDNGRAKKTYEDVCREIEKKQTHINSWTVAETKFLIKYIALYYPCGETSTVWPGTRQSSFWEKCAEYISHGTSKYKRTDMACRKRCRKYLRENFKTLDEAEEAFNIDYCDDIETESNPSSNISELQAFANTFNKFTNGQQWDILHKLYKDKLQQTNPNLCDYVPDDFLKVSVSAFRNLHDYKRRNTLYELAYSIGTARSDESGPRMPLDRMPFPLIETNCHFFTVDYIDQVRYSEEYVKYLETMHTYFGEKWAALHCGPTFKYENATGVRTNLDEDNSGVAPLDQTENSQACDILSMAVESTLGESWGKDAKIEISNINTGDLGACNSVQSGISHTDVREVREGLPSQELQHWQGITPVQYERSTARLQTMDAKVNIVGLSNRTITRRRSQAKCTPDTSDQVEMLLKVKETNPEGRWWIKTDACNIKKEVTESMRREQSGDIDLEDGKVQNSHKLYIEKYKLVHGFMKRNRDRRNDYIAMISALDKDKTFLCTEKERAKLMYEKLKQKYCASDDSLFAIALELEGYDKLIKENTELRQAVEVFDSEVGDMPKTLAVFRSRMKVYLKNVASKEKDAANRLLIFIISDELRNMKPYVLPVRVVPSWNGVITDNEVRILKIRIKASMIAIGMTVVGFVSDREWNSVQIMGPERPVSIVQLIMEAKSNARQTSEDVIEMYLTMDEGDTPLLQHEAVPLQDVKWLQGVIHNEGNRKSFDEAIFALRRKLYPDQYEPKPWTPGQTESRSDCLKSILATYIFRWKIHEYSANGIDFEKHLYVPALDSETQKYLVDTEDHGHLLKRLTACLKKGTIPDVDAQRWTKAIKDPTTGLSALTGKRNLTVGDCEIMFSIGLIDYFEEEGYTNEKRFAEIVLNWHKASVVHGISDQTRKDYNKGILNYILEDWMPYQNEVPGFSYLDVNRPIEGIQGLPRDVIIGLIANIESQELQRTVSQYHNLPPVHHPRAGTSDEVESFISLLHQMIGPIFDNKKFKENYRKICYEHDKRIDKNLPYYYYMGASHR